MEIEYVFEVDGKRYRTIGHDHTAIKVAIHEFVSEISGKSLRPANIISIDGRPSGRIVYLQSKEAKDHMVGCDYNHYVQNFMPMIRESYLSIKSVPETEMI